MKECRVVFTLRITYKTSHDVLSEIPAILRNIIQFQEDTRFDRAHYAKFKTFGLDFEVAYYILSADYNHYMETQQKINLGIREEFDKRGIQFALPQHVRLDQLKNLKNEKITSSTSLQRVIKGIFLTFVLSAMSCSASKTQVAEKSWDRNDDGSIDRREFVEGYVADDHYKFWSSGFGVNSSTFFERLFHRMDLDQDGLLDSQEFNAQIKTYTFGLLAISASDWDTDGNSVLARAEFVGGAATSKLFSLWDTSNDKSINSREMAGGMFYVCDKNNNHGVDADELTAWQQGIPAVK